jgi:Fe-S-cluster containining protein
MSCGACCCNPDQNREVDYNEYVEVEKRDKIRREPTLLKKLTFTNKKGEIHMRLVGVNQRCCALEGRLGEHVSCTIYEFRPGGCRRVQPGDEWCTQLRVERGMDPPPEEPKKKSRSKR